MSDPVCRDHRRARTDDLFRSIPGTRSSVTRAHVAPEPAVATTLDTETVIATLGQRQHFKRLRWRVAAWLGRDMWARMQGR